MLGRGRSAAIVSVLQHQEQQHGFFKEMRTAWLVAEKNRIMTMRSHDAALRLGKVFSVHSWLRLHLTCVLQLNPKFTVDLRPEFRYHPAPPEKPKLPLPQFVEVHTPTSGQLSPSHDQDSDDDNASFAISAVTESAVSSARQGTLKPSESTLTFVTMASWAPGMTPQITPHITRTGDNDPSVTESLHHSSITGSQVRPGSPSTVMSDFTLGSRPPTLDRQRSLYGGMARWPQPRTDGYGSNTFALHFFSTFPCSMSADDESLLKLVLSRKFTSDSLPRNLSLDDLRKIEIISESQLHDNGDDSDMLVVGATGMGVDLTVSDTESDDDKISPAVAAIMPSLPQAEASKAATDPSDRATAAYSDDEEETEPSTITTDPSAATPTPAQQVRQALKRRVPGVPIIRGHPYWGLDRSGRYRILELRYREIASSALGRTIPSYNSSEPGYIMPPEFSSNSTDGQSQYTVSTLYSAGSITGSDMSQAAAAVMGWARNKRKTRPAAQPDASPVSSVRRAAAAATAATLSPGVLPTLSPASRPSKHSGDSPHRRSRSRSTATDTRARSTSSVDSPPPPRQRTTTVAETRPRSDSTSATDTLPRAVGDTLSPVLAARRQRSASTSVAPGKSQSSDAGALSPTLSASHRRHRSRPTAVRSTPSPPRSPLLQPLSRKQQQRMQQQQKQSAPREMSRPEPPPFDSPLFPPLSRTRSEAPSDPSVKALSETSTGTMDSDGEDEIVDQPVHGILSVTVRRDKTRA